MSRHRGIRRGQETQIDPELAREDSAPAARLKGMRSDARGSFLQISHYPKARICFFAISSISGSVSAERSAVSVAIIRLNVSGDRKSTRLNSSHRCISY